MSCTSFSGCAAGSIASSLGSIGVPLTAPYPTWPDKTHRLGYKAKPKLRVYIGFECSVVAANAQFLRVRPQASLPIMVFTSSSLLEGFSLLPRSEVDATVGLWKSWILAGLVKIPQILCGYPRWSTPQDYQKESWHPMDYQPSPQHKELRGLTSAGPKSCGLGKDPWVCCPALPLLLI